MYASKYIIGILLCASLNIFAQTDSVPKIKYTPSFRFTEGLYVSHWNLATNNPIRKQSIVTKLNKNSFDFFKNLLNQNTIRYIDEFGIVNTIKTEDLWGFCKQGAIYINLGDDFNRITIIGNICHFVARFTYETSLYPDPYNGYYNYGYYNTSATTNQTEIRQYLLHFNSGKVEEYNKENVLKIIKQDTTLYNEYTTLRRKKQKKLLFFYLRKYNERHPLFLSVE